MRIVLETRRLVLSEMSLEDLDFYAAMLGDPWVMRFYPKRLNREEAAAAIRQQMDRYARDGVGAWLAREKATGRPVGRIGLMRRPVDGVIETEIAWMVHRPYQRCGYASEGGAACRDYSLGTLGLGRVIALVRPENVPSCGVAEKIGLATAGRTVVAGLEHVVYAAGAGASGGAKSPTLPALGAQKQSESWSKREDAAGANPEARGAKRLGPSLSWDRASADAAFADPRG